MHGTLGTGIARQFYDSSRKMDLILHFPNGSNLVVWMRIPAGLHCFVATNPSGSRDLPFETRSTGENGLVASGGTACRFEFDSHP
ncbi:MAG: hypothetical protein H7A49_12735 [Akkermansiaceae bacterium]|nr:hypothetical protein [Akkermansiaceae bacterium]MCP5544761.1 hypothetical protein [Akkermansiaceae bacterium]